MKKFIYFATAIAAMAFASCSSEFHPLNGDTDTETKTYNINLAASVEYNISSAKDTLATNIANSTSAAKKMSVSRASAADAGLSGGSTARFYIRIDNRIQDEVGGRTYESTAYFPQRENGRSYWGDKNLGKVKLDYDYTEGTSSVPFYVFDSEGIATKAALDCEEPTLQTLIDANMTDIDLSYVKNHEGLKIIWYVVKYQVGSGDNVWHVDGVVTYENVKSIDEIPDFTNPYESGYEDAAKTRPVTTENHGSVEVNLSLKDVNPDHPDYNENTSHLSVHVRDTTDFEVFIPVEEQYYCSQDDMYIVQTHNEGEYVYNEASTEVSMQIGENTVKMIITHEADGIRVKSEGINADVMKICYETNFDGLTFEVWNYFNEAISRADLKAKLDQATVTFTKDTGAYFNAKPSDLDCTVTPPSQYSTLTPIDEPNGILYTKEN